MALNLGAMIQSARSQRNPAGEFISNFQDQNLIGKILGYGQNSTTHNAGQDTAQTAQPAQQTQTGGFSPELALQLLKAKFGG